MMALGEPRALAAGASMSFCIRELRESTDANPSSQRSDRSPFIVPQSPMSLSSIRGL